MENQIIEYLKNKYNPSGIILIGSRATDTFVSKSDWDIQIFTDIEEDSVEDYADLRKFSGEALEVSPNPKKVGDDFIIMTVMHPARNLRVLFDDSDGLMDKIVKNTNKAYEKGPEKITGRKIDLYTKILNKFILKAESREDSPGYTFFGLSQFYHFAIRYWFEVRQEWPLPIYEALPYIKSKDEDFFENIEIIRSQNESSERKIEVAKKIRDILFSPQNIK